MKVDIDAEKNPHFFFWRLIFLWISHRVNGHKLFASADRHLGGSLVGGCVMFCTDIMERNFLYSHLTTVVVRWKNGLGCKWLVKLFSTLILDSRYFYSQEEKSLSCLPCSLACSVYSICWAFWIFNKRAVFICHLRAVLLKIHFFELGGWFTGN